MNKLFTILIVILLPICISGQQKVRKQPLPLAKFEDNVKLPLTSKERSQITEVYGEYADKYIFNNENRLRGFKQILRNRVVIKKITDKNEIKECPNLSEVPLFKKFAPELKRDDNFNPKEFNPLKYSFAFYSASASMYQVDNTNYYIIIKSQHQ